MGELDRLILGDCFDVLPRLVSDGLNFDCCITDIPYAETRAKWDTSFNLDKMLEYLHKLVKFNGAICLFCNEPYSSYVRISNIGEYRYDFKWVKNRATGFANANYRPMRRYEDILVFSQSNDSAGGKRNPMKYNPQGLVEINKVKKNTEKRKGLIQIDNFNCGSDNVINSNSEYTQRFTNYPDNILEFDCDKNYLHPTMKPLKLMEYLVRTFSNTGDSVLDFTCGSGTTCLACKNTNRRYVGIEKDEKFFEIAKNRLTSAYQQELF